MPLKKRSRSVLKNIRKSARRREMNRARRLRLKSLLKQMRSLKEKEAATRLLPEVQSAVDKAARRGIIHRNKAARLKSQLVRTVAALS